MNKVFEKMRNEIKTKIMYDPRVGKYVLCEYKIKDIQFEGINEYFLTDDGRKAYIRFYPDIDKQGYSKSGVPIRDIIQ